MSRTAVILLNLGGPDGLEAVRPFLFNLFYDPAIFRIPNPLRFLLAKLVARKREAEAKHIYAALGGKSPLVAQTQAQAAALDAALAPHGTYKTFLAMRYWHPMTPQTVREVKAWNPDRVVLLPLYPQFSTATTASSFKAWREEAARQGLDAPTELPCCYPEDSGFIEAYAALILSTIRDLPRPLRLLFSAHGLPKRVIEAGDPYQSQVERSVAAILETLRNEPAMQGVESRICYQSRVGPLAWIGPATEDEVAAAGEEKIGLAVVPVAFVSEHSETLFELDMAYREFALSKGAPFFARVPAPGAHPRFIEALAALARRKSGSAPSPSAEGKPGCGPEFKDCPYCRAA